MCLGALFILLGIIYLIRRPKIKRLEPSMFPDLPPDQVEKWKRYEIISIDVFVVGSLGGGILGTAVALAAGFAGGALIIDRQLADTLIVASTIGQVVLLVVGLIVSAAYGTSASALRKKLRIRMSYEGNITRF